jgi:hypothetical protein
MTLHGMRGSFTGFIKYLYGKECVINKFITSDLRGGKAAFL